MFPANSFRAPSTFNGANSIGKLPARPLVIPKNAVCNNHSESQFLLRIFIMFSFKISYCKKLNHTYM